MGKKGTFEFVTNYNITFATSVVAENEKAAREFLVERLKEWMKEGGFSFTVPEIEAVDISCVSEELLLDGRGEEFPLLLW